MTDHQTPSDWISLLSFPRAILNAYSGKPPPLRGFLLDTVILSGNKARLIGQFGTLPEVALNRWIQNGKPTAPGYIELSEIRKLTISGLPGSGPDDDPMHGYRVGLPVDFQLTATGEVFTSVGFGNQPWCRLDGVGSGFEFSAEAVDVSIMPGRGHSSYI